MKIANLGVLASTEGDSGSCLNLMLRNQTTSFKILRAILCGFWTLGINANLRMQPLFPWMIQKYLCTQFPSQEFFFNRKMYSSCCSFHKINVLQKTIIQMSQTSSWQALMTQINSLFSKLCFYFISCPQPLPWHSSVLLFCIFSNLIW